VAAKTITAARRHGGRGGARAFSNAGELKRESWQRMSWIDEGGIDLRAMRSEPGARQHFGVIAKVRKAREKVSS